MPACSETTGNKDEKCERVLLKLGHVQTLLPIKRHNEKYRVDYSQAVTKSKGKKEGKKIVAIIEGLVVGTHSIIQKCQRYGEV